MAKRVSTTRAAPRPVASVRPKPQISDKQRFLAAKASGLSQSQAMAAIGLKPNTLSTQVVQARAAQIKTTPLAYAQSHIKKGGSIIAGGKKISTATALQKAAPLLQQKKAISSPIIPKFMTPLGHAASIPVQTSFNEINEMTGKAFLDPLQITPMAHGIQSVPVGITDISPGVPGHDLQVVDRNNLLMDTRGKLVKVVPLNARLRRRSRRSRRSGGISAAKLNEILQNERIQNQSQNMLFMMMAALGGRR